MAEPRTADAHIDDLAAFIGASPSSYHAAAEAVRRLVDAGFTLLDERDDWPEAVGRYCVVRDGAVAAWVVPDSATATTPVRIVGAHTDSPGFKLKPRPTTTNFGWLQAGVEIYGGPLLNSWLDRDLELAGRLVTTDGREHLVRTGPMLRIPQLAIHLDRAVNDGLTLGKQAHMQPIWGVEGQAGETDHDALLAHLADRAGVDAATLAGYDLLTADTQAPARLGVAGRLFAAGRMDNLVSVHAGAVALADLVEPEHIAVLAAFDHEEVGSGSASGAGGPLLDDVLARIGDQLGAGPSEVRRSRAGSLCLSVDAGHAVHPNYAERHDPANQPQAGAGPLLKLNAKQRYASDAVGSAAFAEACQRAGVVHQPFVSNNDVPCGSTIGPITAARLGIRTVDVGVPLLSMHSARELAHVDDVVALGRAVAAFWA